MSVTVQDPLFVPLADGTRLAATLWRPAGVAPVVLEAVPYRRRDGTIFRDSEMAPWYAEQGIAYCRLDLRGSGESDGVLEDEYLPLEQEDLCQVIAWLAAQPWCNGRVGMTGISWGGFNALQVAALRPPALRAVIALCCSDDRFADDVHYMGGAYLTEDPLWSAFILALNALPPDPQQRPDWQALWAERRAANRCWSETWLAHQARDAYWRQGSICEDWSRIAVPVYAVGGWDDSYSNAVPRLLQHLRGPKKGLIGPWSHSYPCRGTPGPTIGWLQEALRWWRHWLLDERTGILDEPPLRVWMSDPEPPLPWFGSHPGRWVAEPGWPRDEAPLHLHLNAGGLGSAPEPGPHLRIRSPAHAGMECGRWGGYGGTCPDMPTDQRREDAQALCFDTPPLAEDLELLGAPALSLRLACDAPRANLTARLCQVAPDGTSFLVSWGTLNLAHRDDPAAPSDLVPDREVAVTLRLNDVARRIPAGHRLRLALATQHWPILWPQPWLAEVTLASGQGLLALPLREPRPEDADLAPFAPTVTAPPVACSSERDGRHERVLETDVGSGRREVRLFTDYGRTRLTDSGIVTDSWCRDRFSVLPEDPLSATLESEWFIAMESGGVAADATARVALTGDATTLRLDWQVTARQDGRVIDERRGRHALARRHL